MRLSLDTDVKTNEDAYMRDCVDVFRAREALWLWLSVIAAVLAIAGSVTALSVKSVYATLTPSFLAEALAQDVVNVTIVSPFCWCSLG